MEQTELRESGSHCSLLPLSSRLLLAKVNQKPETRKPSKCWGAVRDKAGVGKWLGASLIAQVVKNLPAMQETPVQFLDWEDPLEKE